MATGGWVFGEWRGGYSRAIAGFGQAASYRNVSGATMTAAKIWTGSERKVTERESGIREIPLGQLVGVVCFVASFVHFVRLPAIAHP